MIRTDYNPKHYRFPRTWRDSNGGENLAPLPARLSFLGRDYVPRVGLILAALAFVAAFALGYFIQ